MNGRRPEDYEDYSHHTLRRRGRVLPAILLLLVLVVAGGAAVFFLDILDGGFRRNVINPDVFTDGMAELRQLRDRLVHQELGRIDVKSGRPIFLKHALSALILPRICAVFDTRLIYVLRPTGDIEATRLRRNWTPEFGAQGAKIVYSHMFRTLVEHEFPTTIVRYSELIASPLQHTRNLSEFSGLENTQPAIEQAAKFIQNRRSSR